MSEDPRVIALRVECWCGATPGEPCQGRPPRENARRRRQRVSLHRWRYCRSFQPAWRLPLGVRADA